MTVVKSPYNFVPAPVEDQVFKPDWANQVSHDIPFEDGESGEIEIEITAETPIFIRNGYKKPNENEKPTEKFSHFVDGNGQKQYFIPATSIKGMVRNVMEIMSFSRLAPVILGDTIFGLRDDFNVQGSSYKSDIKDVQSGWLIKEDGKWRIYKTPSDRVTLESICKYFGIKDSKEFKELSATEKYKRIKFKSFEEPLGISKGHFIPKTGQFYNLDSNGDFESYPVIYGPFTTKKYEYLFHDFEENEKPIELESQSLITKILDIEKNNNESLWHFFLKEQKLNRVPVFFKSSNNKVTHFGFSKLYRLNNGSYLKELSPVSTYNLDEGIDLAQTIFGHVGDESLKGRVYFSHALAEGNPEEDGVKKEILGSPKASYYPFYLKQDGKKFNTYQSKTSELRGFKKYHSQNLQSPTKYTQDQLDSDSMVSFNPLKSETKFKLNIRYHNLRKVEIGALLSALTYHGNHSELRHNLGLAKSFGYGRVKFELKLDSEKLKGYLRVFEELMNSHTQKFGQKWVETEQMKDLGAMAKVATENNKLSYPKLEIEKRNPRNNRIEKVNEFNEIKKALEFLKNPSHYNSYSFKSLTS
jgi:CRISPR-associated protein (TIGR03986 family)